MKHDLLHIQGKPYVLVPLHEYRTITDESGKTEGGLPDDILDALSAKQESPVRILRKFRGLTQEALAEAAGLSRPYLTEIEKGRKTGSVGAVQAIARALSVSVRHLMA
jgi:DNA-binding XRE family transcriptional regulator